MDQQKIGEFLKTLRKDKNLTQEELADKMNVSRRTVSRWETGSNLPDLSILVELADLYDVDMREIFNGERKNETVDKDLKETMLMAADYTDDNMKKVMKRMQLMFIGASAGYKVFVAETDITGVVTAKDADVVSAPSDRSQTLNTLSEGTSFEVLGVQGNFAEIRLGEKVKGFVKLSEVGIVK